MKIQRITYLSLGSNQGDKLQNLQNAVDAIAESIGAIQKIASVYKTSSWGFEGGDFYNTCIRVSTYLQPDTLMRKLLEIENNLGRVRNDSEEYTDRVIDLDILLFDDEIIFSKELRIPHPRMLERKFVMVPLEEIARSTIHPVVKKQIHVCLHNCIDDTNIEAISDQLKRPIPLSEKYNYIAIEGNIGAGKTSLANKIAHDFNAKLILERFADNPFLPKFYEEPQRYAFTLEMSFLADRYQQISDDLSQLDLFKDFMVSDYDIYKSLIFSKITLPEDEFKLYRKLFYLMYKDIAKPELYVYLYQNTERLQENIKKRGRDYEQNIDNDYLEKINSGYLEFLKNQTELNVKIIDISDRDFVENRADYLWVLEQICSE